MVYAGMSSVYPNLGVIDGVAKFNLPSLRIYCKV